MRIAVTFSWSQRSFAAMIVLVTLVSGCSVIPKTTGDVFNDKEKQYPDPAAEMWITIRNSGDTETFNKFISTFPNSPYVHAAKVKLDTISATAKPRFTLDYDKLKQLDYDKLKQVIVESLGGDDPGPGSSGDTEIPNHARIPLSTNISDGDGMFDRSKKKTTILRPEASDFNWKGKVRTGNTVTVRGVSGSIEVRLGHEHVRVEATKKGPRDDLDKVDISAVESHKGVLVSAKYPPNRVLEVQVAFRVWIPAGVNLQAETRQGDIFISGVSGSVYAESTQGDIELEHGGVAHAETRTITRQGDIFISGVSGSVYAESTQGDIELEYGGIAHAETRQGDIDVVMKSNSPGDTSFITVQGDINVNFPPNIGAVIYSTTVQGRIDIDSLIPHRDAPIFKSRAFRDGKLDFCLRRKNIWPIEECPKDHLSGASRIEISTTQGDIGLLQIGRSVSLDR